MTDDVLLNVVELYKHFPIVSGIRRREGVVRAVDGVSFSIRRGETLGLVGESGSGKSTVARLILRLYEPTAGKVIFRGNDIFSLGGEKLRRIRKDMQMIFQDPFSSLNPRMRIFDIVAEPLATHTNLTRKEIEKKVVELIRVVGLKSHRLHCYPHQFSGGQRQRIGIARALSLSPKLIICDEPVSALDVSIQAQILNLLKDLQDKFELTYLFISHDLHVVRYMSTRICVMYLGKVVEEGPAEEVFISPAHPYTKSLVSAVPVADPTIRERDRIILEGEPASPINPPHGCRFHPRCPLSKPRCTEEEPPVLSVGSNHSVACHFPLVH